MPTPPDAVALAQRLQVPDAIPAPAPRWTSRWRWYVGAALTLLTVAALATNVDWPALQQAIGRAGDAPGLLLLVAALYAGAFLLRAMAWRLLLARPVPLQQLFANLQACLFANHVFPFKAGEPLRPYLAWRHGTPAGTAIATTVTARLLDFLCLGVLVAAAFPATWSSGATRWPYLLASAGLVAGASGMFLLRAGLLRLPGDTLGGLGERFAVQLRAVSASRIAIAFPLVLASWMLEAAVVAFGAHILDIDLSLRAAIGVTAFTILFQVVHVTPGGVGVYETAMTTALVALSVPAEQALGLAVLTHALKFGYSFAVGGPFALSEGVFLLRGRRGAPVRAASRLEVVVARAWNVVNEGRPFTPVFTAAVILLLLAMRLGDAEALRRAPLAIAALVPVAVVFYRFDFPLRLRIALWVYLLGFIAITRAVPLGPAALVLALYFGFTVVLWGTIYYHLRIGTPWSNGFRFVRLVVENPDPTSGNFLEQVPKILLLVFLFEFGMGHGAAETAGAGLLVAAVVGVSALLLHQWLFTWVPPLPQPALPLEGADAAPPYRRARRVIGIVIDGCRADRLLEARTPNIDCLRASGTDFRAMSTVYPARTVTCFSSMLTGAPPGVHGMHSNFVPNLGVKCESVFGVLRERGMTGRLVGIAHLVDAFGDDVVPVTAVMDNDEIDHALLERAQRVMEDENPELLVLQFLSVDQTGHARGSYNAEYLAKIEETDRLIGTFLAWCDERGYLEDATVILTADHGQGIGIGGHGHMSPSETRIPAIVAGAGVPAGVAVEEPRFITDIAATICASLGVRQPRESVGRDLMAPTSNDASGPVVFVIPARNEEARLGAVLHGIARTQIPSTRVIVVDDGSTDATAAVARNHGASVVSHPISRGLGAALRTGLAAARSLHPRAVVYLDADGEYDPADAVRLLAPIESGEANYVLGSRFKGSVEGMTFSRRIANRVFSLVLSVACRRWISDGQTGIRAFSPRALAVAEIIHDYNYAQVLTLDLLRKRMRMIEVPASYRRRGSGRSFISSEYLWRVPLGMVREMLHP